MVSKRKKKYSSGEGAQFTSRKSALKRLQLSMKDFRRLCILKGIYPREPRNRKRAQKGAGGIKTLYHTKDVQFLMHEPIIWKLRDLKVYHQRIQRAKALRDKRSVKRYMDNYPVVNIDHIVKERYPTFIDALRDLDDCLTLCFLFSTFPSIRHVPREFSVLCRRLTVEFMHAVIAAKAIRKVFVSVKGYYYQAEIKGQMINWIVPHQFSFQPQAKDEVDFKLMSTFVEFYTVMLGFINFRLYHSLNLQYPPALAHGVVDCDKSLVDEETYTSERISALNMPLVALDTGIVDEGLSIDEFPSDQDPEKLEEAKKEMDKVKYLTTMFKGLKFFINREVPREPLVFLIKCFGGEVSWDKLLFVGSTFDENDETITHHIVDRPSMDKKFISRYYLQPQWIFDSINQRTLLPINKYLMGATLPPHLSPFIDKEKSHVYIPPEARAINEGVPEEKDNEDRESNIDKASDEEDEESSHENVDMGEAEMLEKAYNDEMVDDSESFDDSDSDGETHKKSKGEKKKGMAVVEGQLEKPVAFEKERQEKHEYQLREKMIKKKHRRLYKSMMEGRKKRKQEIWLLRKKRRLHEEKEKQTTSKKGKKTEAKT